MNFVPKSARATNGKFITDTMGQIGATTGSYGDLDWMGVRNRMGSLNGTTWQTLSTSTTVNPWTALQAGTSLITDQTVGLPGPITPAATPSSDDLAFAALNAGATNPAWMAGAGGHVLP